MCRAGKINCLQLLTTGAMAIILAAFQCQARGIKFYDVPSESVRCGLDINCRLEPGNLHDSSCVALVLKDSKMLGHLAKEVAQYLAPLLRKGVTASG